MNRHFWLWKGDRATLFIELRTNVKVCPGLTIFTLRDQQKSRANMVLRVLFTKFQSLPFLSAAVSNMLFVS
jgi:hypothetical protein